MCDSDGGINGVVWQTTMMWYNFERFGSCECLDVMKRGINKLLWPCTAIGMRNGMDQAYVSGEGIFCDERELAHLCVVQFLLMNTLARPEHKVYSVSSDGYFNQAIIEH